ncbi:hypothetical protein AB3329_01755 [Streptococcus sp. H31]|uniref:hypothetical protein n=1 Tax=Streptococcus huangxiaojuni TaxID=3237239 RepID=UPI0034A5CC4C
MIPKFEAYVKFEGKTYPVTKIDWIYGDVQMNERPHEEGYYWLFTLPFEDVVLKEVKDDTKV